MLWSPLAGGRIFTGEGEEEVRLRDRRHGTDAGRQQKPDLMDRAAHQANE